MARRRVLPFSAFARRKWRVVGLTLVLMIATVMFFALTDRGHDPLWRERGGDEVVQVTASPDGRVLLAVTKADGNVSGLTAYDAAAGDRMWTQSVNFTDRVMVAAGDGWFAVTSPAVGARLEAYDASDGSRVHREYLDAAPRALAADGRALALTLRTDALIVYEDFEPVVTRDTPGLVSALDASGGRVAVGTGDGRLLVYERGREVLNTTVDLRVQSLRLSRDAGNLFVGGSVQDAGFGGGVAYFSLFSDTPTTPSWTQETDGHVGFVDMDTSGRYVIALEAAISGDKVHYWDAVDPAPAWSRQVDGVVFRDDAGLTAGVGVSPDGRLVAFTPHVGGAVTVVDATTADVLWTWDAEGASTIAFPESVADGRFGTNARLVPARPYDHVLFFDAAREPFPAEFPRFAFSLVATELAGGLVVLGAGYWWYRRA